MSGANKVLLAVRFVRASSWLSAKDKARPSARRKLAAYIPAVQGRKQSGERGNHKFTVHLQLLAKSCGMGFRSTYIARFATWAAVSLTCIGFVTPAHADVERTQSQVGVVTRLSFIQTEELSFGQIFASNASGTITVAPSGVRSRTGGVTLTGNTHHTAIFAGFGQPNQRVQISLGSNSIFLTGPGTRMRAHTFVIGSTPTAVLTTTPRVFRIATPSGGFAFPVGATLDVNANQAPGTYRGTWTITLNYQ